MITAEEQIQQNLARLLQCSPAELKEMLDSEIEIDSRHTQTMSEMIAKSLVSISRNPSATKECRMRALRCAKEYLQYAESRDPEEGTQQ